MANLGSHAALATESAERLIESLFPQTSRPEQGGRKPLSESDLRRVSDVLRRMGKDSWSRVPRVYAVLRTINQLQVLDSFIAQGVSDVWFPFSHKTLPDTLRNPSSRFEFLEAQDLVLTKALDLEREDGKHRHFSRAEDVPLSKLEELGKGGFGYVDRVLSNITYKEYARKLIPRGRTFKRDMEVLRDFERELGHLKKLSHLHIVELVGSYTDPKFVGIIMSPVADYNLKEFLALDPLPAGGRSFLRTFFGCLASALCYLHDNRVRHKDVKPQNVLVKGHQVYLTDFGISLDWSDLGQSTTSGPTIKTPRYCAPEVADYAPRNTLSDVWSLGCVFLEIWTVLKGETITALLEYLENHNSRSTCYYLNCNAIKAWCKTLSEKPGTSSDNPPSACIYEMMQSDQNRRWTARMTLDCIQEANADPDNRFAFSGLCCVDDEDSDESLHSSKRNSANLDETGASSLGVPPTHTPTNVDDSTEAGRSATDLTSSQTLKPSRPDKPVIDPSESTIDAHARQDNQNMTTPLFGLTDSELASRGLSRDQISKEAQLRSESSISTFSNLILTSDLFAHSTRADQLSKNSESLDRPSDITASSLDKFALRPLPLNSGGTGSMGQAGHSEVRGEPIQAIPMGKTSPYKLIPAVDIQQTASAQDSGDEDWHDPEISHSSGQYKNHSQGPEFKRKLSFSRETTESTIFNQSTINKVARKDYDKRITITQGASPFVVQNLVPKIQATTSQQEPRISDEEGAVHETAVERKPVAIDQRQTGGLSVKGTELRATGNLRACKECSEPLTGQFVRALEGTFHLTCFKCRDCGQIVASKFFPVEDEDSNGGDGKYPLCETDYFRRLDLLCYDCGRPLRDSFITALDRKYHIEHLACNVCRLPFGEQTYYEHEGQPYCHYHHSALAQKCQSCTGAIFKQYVEIFRNGQNQSWHPECFMIHKYWNIHLSPELPLGIDLSTLSDNPTEEQREALRRIHDKLDERVYRIWHVFSDFEESSATFISDMLRHVSDGAYTLTFSSAQNFLGCVATIFDCLEGIQRLMTTNNVKGISYMRGANLLCKKIVAFFTLIARTQEIGVKKLGVTQELLSVVTGLAHYLKLLIQTCLKATLRLEGQKPKTEALSRCLDWIGAASPGPDLLTHPETVSRLARDDSDCCASCQKPVKDACIRCEDESWHKECLRCSECAKHLVDQLEGVFRSRFPPKTLCGDCIQSSRLSNTNYHLEGRKVVFVTELEQYVFLLSIAMARFMRLFQEAGIMISGETEFPVSDASVDPSLRPSQPSGQQSIAKSPVTTDDEKDGDQNGKTKNFHLIEGTDSRVTDLVYSEGDALFLQHIPGIVAAEQSRQNTLLIEDKTSQPTKIPTAQGFYQDPPPVSPLPPGGIIPSPSSLRQKAKDLFLKRSPK